MNDWTFSPQFEENVRKSFNAPAIRAEFVDQVYGELLQRAALKVEKPRSSFRLRPAWSVALFILFMIILGTLAIGPQRVFAAVGRFFGYIPGVGIVEDGTSFRILAEPVSVTKEGVTVTVTDALLTDKKTVVLFSIENVSFNALSHDENVPGCLSTPELHLPNNEIFQIISGGGGPTGLRFVYPSISPDINESLFILPCITSTLPGLAPENWELSLRFIPAPPGMKTLPVLDIEVTPTALTNLPADLEQPLSIIKVIEIEDNYIVFGEFNPEKAGDPTDAAAQWQLTDAITLKDGEGTEIYFTYPPSDIDLPKPSQPNTEVLAFQISKRFVSPLIISYPGIFIKKVGDVHNFEFEFDTGTDPQVGQQWLINKDITVDGYNLRLASIVAGQDGYSFNFDRPEPVKLFTEDAHTLSPEAVEISGHTAIGGGGGGGTLSLVYPKIPYGKLNVVISVQHLHSTNAKTWQVQWVSKEQTSPLYGLSLNLDKFIPADDGYYLIGHIEWTDERVTNVTEYGNMRAFAADGRELVFKKVSYKEAVTLVENLEPSQWVYRLSDISFEGAITLRLGKVNVEFVNPVRFTLDLRPYGFSFADDQIGLSWKTGMNQLNIPGITANYFKVKYLRNEKYSGFEFGINSDPHLLNLALDFDSGVINEQESLIPEFKYDDKYKVLFITVLSDGQLSMPLGFVAYGADISGVWETIWSPPLP